MQGFLATILLISSMFLGVVAYADAAENKQKKREEVATLFCLKAASFYAKSTNPVSGDFYLILKEEYFDDFARAKGKVPHERREMRLVYDFTKDCDSYLKTLTFSKLKDENALLHENATLAAEKARAAFHDYYHSIEEEIYEARLGEQKGCVEHINGVVTGFMKPKKHCRYQTATFMKVLQLVEEGALIRLGQTGSFNNLFFIKRSGNLLQGLADGSLVPDGGYFKYSGIKTYQSLTGKRAVHSFTPLLNNPLSGLYFYRP